MPIVIKTDCNAYWKKEMNQQYIGPLHCVIKNYVNYVNNAK